MRTLAEWQSDFSMRMPAKWQNDSSMRMPAKWQNDSSMRMPAKWQNDSSLRTPAEWQSDFSMRMPAKWQNDSSMRMPGQGFTAVKRQGQIVCAIYVSQCYCKQILNICIHVLKVTAQLKQGKQFPDESTCQTDKAKS